MIDKKRLYFRIVSQIMFLILIIVGIILYNNGQNGVILFYAAFSLLIIVFITEIYLTIRNSRRIKNK